MFTSLPLALAAAAQAPAQDAARGEEMTIDVVGTTSSQPAVLINRGIALATQGREAEARQAFEAVRKMKVNYTLETRDGRWVYPPDLARAALKGLDSGHFRKAGLALRD